MIIFPSMEERSDQRFHSEGGWGRFCDNLKNNGLITPDKLNHTAKIKEAPGECLLLLFVLKSSVDDKRTL